MPMKAVYRTVNGRILGHNKAGVASEYLLDPLGSVIGTSTSAGVVSNRTTYWPYGEVRTGGVSSVTPFGFCGAWGYYTDSSGSLNVRARYYRPSLTRWQTVDPLWPMERAYGYVQCSPTVLLDYAGKKPKRVPRRLIKTLPNFDLVDELCGNQDPLACGGVNAHLPPCTKGHPLFDICGRHYIGANPPMGGCANRSNWPCPKPQISFLPPGLNGITGEYCCKECEMRVCCHLGGPYPIPPTPVGPPLVWPIAPEPIYPGMPVRFGTSPIWQ
jgi:RHS repeat-associated protein